MESPNSHGSQERRLEILIVEDSPAQADLLSHVLMEKGYTTMTACNGREALTMIRAARPFIVISDIIMPEVDGYQLCRAIKTDDALKDTPVILLTALSDPEDVLKALECGADGFFTKPYDEDYLVSRINGITMNAQLRRESKMQPGAEVFFNGRRYRIASERSQILDLLLSTYETAVMRNRELKRLKEKLEVLNESLEQTVEERTGALVAEIEERKKAQEELQKHREHLQDLVSERTAELLARNNELRREISERKQAEREINRLNSELVQRARDLEIAMEDLESFSFSVSHDLKAPLRVINGFTYLLTEKHLARLTPDAARLLNLISENTRKMGELIDDVLEFSRAGRREMKPREIDMEKLARSVAEGLTPSLGSRTVRIEVGELSPALGDESALRQVFFNLISNAVKFTRSMESALIQVGCREERDENTYYVKDNGVGFDERYADKLFGVFQRLHSATEFEGSGIGLAIVKRIIFKLGGRVSAESRLNEGATFSFTLPRPPHDGQG